MLHCKKTNIGPIKQWLALVVLNKRELTVTESICCCLYIDSLLQFVSSSPNKVKSSFNKVSLCLANAQHIDDKKLNVITYFFFNNFNKSSWFHSQPWSQELFMMFHCLIFPVCYRQLKYNLHIYSSEMSLERHRKHVFFIWTTLFHTHQTEYTQTNSKQILCWEQKEVCCHTISQTDRLHSKTNHKKLLNQSKRKSIP